MARISVDVPDSVLGEEKAKELASARKRIKTLEAKLSKLESTHAEAKEIIKTWQACRSSVASILDLYDGYPDWL